MIKRLRRTHDEKTLRELYGKPYDSSEWDEHRRRVDWTIDRLNLFLGTHPEIVTAVDLSCGDGRILRDIVGPTNRYFGDIANAPHIDRHGPIEETIENIRGDLLICSETLEHLDDPSYVLDRVATRFTWICITTPLGEVDPEKNHEHYWGWDLWGISSLLSENGWTPRWVDTLNESYYTYQLWIARTMWD